MQITEELIDDSNSQNETEKELIEFNILKTQGKLERLFVIVFFSMLYFLIIGILFKSLEDKATLKISMGVIGLAMLGIERIYDNAVRNRIIGKGKLYPNKICLNNIEYDFRQINMLWVNYGLNTKTKNEDPVTNNINDYETLKLTIIEPNDKFTHFHIDNSSSTFNFKKVSEYIEQIRQDIRSFKIHFDNSHNFSKEEYLKIIKRHEIMKSSLRRRKNKTVSKL